MSEAYTIQPRLMSVKQLAEYLSFPVSTIYAMVGKKTIPFKRFGKKSVRFERKEIDKWIDEQDDRSYFRS